MKRFAYFSALFAFSAAFLVACGGSDSPAPAQVAASDLSTNATAATTAPLSGLTLTSGATGISSLGTTSTTTVAISGAAGSQTAVITEGAQSATTRLTFGSCIFTVISSNFPASHPLGSGKIVTISQCIVTANTSGLVVDSAAANRLISLIFGSENVRTTSPVSVSSNGALRIGSTTVIGITLALTNATGTN
jgi:hypothetical protein